MDSRPAETSTGGQQQRADPERPGSGQIEPTKPAFPELDQRRTRKPADAIDRQLVELLAEDGRATNRALANRVGLTEVTVAARLRRLFEDEIVKVTAVFDREAAGFGWTLWLAVETYGSARSIAELLVDVENVYQVALMFGGYDVIIQVIAADRRELSDTLEAVLRLDGVRRCEPIVELNTARYRWGLAIPLSGESPALRFPAPPTDLDDLDMRLLTALVEDGRQSNRKIGRALGVAEGTIRGRISRLEKSGLMHIVALYDPIAAGMSGHVVGLGVHVQQRGAEEIAQHIGAFPETLMSASTLGLFDVFAFLLSDSMERLVSLITVEIASLPGVRRTETWQLVEVLKYSPQYVRLL